MKRSDFLFLLASLAMFCIPILTSGMQGESDEVVGGFQQVDDPIVVGGGDFVPNCTKSDRRDYDCDVHSAAPQGAICEGKYKQLACYAGNPKDLVYDVAKEWVCTEDNCAGFEFTKISSDCNFGTACPGNSIPPAIDPITINGIGGTP
jgi:hypothetical protein